MDTASPLSSSLTRPSLVTLPVECRQAILTYLPDVSSLGSTILSHSSLYTAFLGYKDFIIKCVLYTLVSSDLLAEACLVLELSQVKIRTREQVLDALARYRRRYVPLEWTLKDAFFIERLHRSIDYFTRDFARTALSQHPLTNVAEEPSPVSPAEWHRIARSFYWYEHYTRLFYQRHRKHEGNRHFPRFRRNDQFLIFLKRFSTEELEQLACVGEYLYRELSKREIPCHLPRQRSTAYAPFSVQRSCRT